MAIIKQRKIATSLDARSKVGTELQSSRKIDRLSSLPPELLTAIFNEAVDVLHGPISKRLLPFQQVALYRTISMFDQVRIIQLVNCIKQQPSLGRLVKSLKIIGNCEELRVSLHAIEIQQFFGRLSNLQTLDLSGYPLSGTFENLYLDPTLASVHLPSLTCFRFNGICSFKIFASFPNLVRLELDDFDQLPEDVSVNALQPVPILTHLEIEGYASDSLANSALFALFPCLTHLRVQGLHSSFSELLSKTTSNLTFLELRACDADNQPEICDQVISRFTKLEHLYLDHQMFSPDLPSRLHALTSLKSLTLGLGSISTRQLISLISGPSRLPLLHKLDLELTFSRLGESIGFVQYAEAFQKHVSDEDDPEEGGLVGRDWILPVFDEENDFTYEGTKELFRAAAEEGIEIGGHLKSAMCVYESYPQEVANVAVYRCYRDEDFKHIHKLRTDFPQYCSKLPPLELDSLDPTDLKLVKIDLPEEGWFRLTLEN